jgi:TonB-linked SusC/RagA family outer membrane protein
MRPSKKSRLGVLTKVPLLSAALLLFITAMAQQNVRVTGRITDGNTGAAIAGASITISNTKKGTVSDDNGNFSVTTSKGSVLEFTFSGYKPKTITVEDDLTINVTLESLSAQLTDVVVVGYGERRRRDITGAVSTVKSDVIEKSSALTPELALQGRAPGVFVGSGGGSPNARQTVRIRGVNTFNGNNDPLYIIDGVPLTEGGAGITGGVIGDLRGNINIFSLINPADIESMTVLKDASAAAIYGVRAANGVILITTKRGKSGKPRVEFNMSYGVQNIPKLIDVLNTQQYVSLYEEAYANNPNINQGQPVPFGSVFGAVFDRNSPQFLGNSPTYNWQKEQLNRNAALQSYNMKVSGGSENTNYYVSAGYDYSESPLKGNNQKRYSVASNVTSRLSKYIETGLTMRLVHNEVIDNTRADLLQVSTAPPWQKIYDPDHPTGFAPAVEVSFVNNPNYNPSALQPGPTRIYAPGYPRLLWGPQTRFNPFAAQALNDLRYNGQRVLGNAYVQIQPIKNLRIKGSIGGDYYLQKRYDWNPVNAVVFSQTPSNPYEGQDGTAIAIHRIRNAINTNLIKELTVSYTTTIGKIHQIDVIAGASDQEYRWSYEQLQSPVNFAPRNYYQRPIVNQVPFVGAERGLLQNYALIGYVGRLNYKLKDKYMLDFTIRHDGSSRFAPGYRWGTFPSLAAAWRISEEKFLSGVSWINDMKIRANWGQLGNEQNTGGFAYLSTVSLSPDAAFGSGNGNAFGTQLQGARLPNFPNFNLRWETLTTQGIGIDAVLFNNKLNVTLEYYDKLNKDIIQTAAVPPSTGIESNPDLNIAQVRNSGIELNLGYNQKIGLVNFNANANLTTVNNKVVKLNDGAPLGGEFGRIEEGFSMFYLWGYKFGGIFQNQDQIDAWRRKYTDVTVGQAQNNPSAGYQPRPGDAWFVDVHGNPRPGEKEFYSPIPDSLINANDRTYLGRTIPGYYYGFSFGAEYKGFDVNVFFQGVGNVQRYNFARLGGESMSSNGANQWATTLNRWTPTNPSTTMPRAVFGDPNQNNRVSSRFVENAGFLRLKNLQLGYNLPKNLVTRLGFMNGLRVYVSAINLLTFTQWSGWDPEVDGIPPTRQFIFGLNAQF